MAMRNDRDSSCTKRRRKEGKRSEGASFVPGLKHSRAQNKKTCERAQKIVRSHPNRVCVTHGWFHIDTIRKYNPNLDEEQAHRAYVRTSDEHKYTIQDWDHLVDYLSCADEKSRRIVLERVSQVALQPTELQLYSTSFDADTILCAVYAGFFLFGSEFEFPGKSLADRSFLNMELTMGASAEEGRIVLCGGRSLAVGKKFSRAFRRHSQHPTSRRSSPGCTQSRYRMTINTCFDEVCDRIIEQHGVDWVGFLKIRTAFSRLARQGSFVRQKQRPAPHPCTDAHDYAAVNEFATDLVRFISIELWDTSAAGAQDSLVSGEIGYIVGSCYTCLSLFTRDGESANWLSRLRAKTAVLLLEQAGVQLFDVGCTAEYYCHLHGFEKCSRKDFVRLWRTHRATELHSPEILARACDDVSVLFEMHQQRLRHAIPPALSPAPVDADEARGTANPASGPGPASSRAVCVTWSRALPGATAVTLLQQRLLSCGSIAKIIARDSHTAVVVFADAAAAQAAVHRAVDIGKSLEAQMAGVSINAVPAKRQRRKQPVALATR
eukprot:m.372384 g.372384  ORF g.372384 m.372384 type:complete len:549 (-) comp20873_c0_seq1:30-1676(-)